jgi:hypothetical protein
MRSESLPSFWEAYVGLGQDIKAHARKAYRLGSHNPFYPSLHFKCINRDEKYLVRENHAEPSCTWCSRGGYGYMVLDREPR